MKKKERWVCFSFFVGSCLQEHVYNQIREVLKVNESVFAWNPSDIIGISPDLICHRLNIDPYVTSIIQKKHSYAFDKQAIISAEIEKLKNAGFIREIFYPKWLANVVLVKKPNKKW